MLPVFGLFRLSNNPFFYWGLPPVNSGEVFGLFGTKSGFENKLGFEDLF